MSYIDIIVTAAYPDKVEVTNEVPDYQTFINGRWHYEVSVVGSDLEPEDFQRGVRDNTVFRAVILEDKI